MTSNDAGLAEYDNAALRFGGLVRVVVADFADRLELVVAEGARRAGRGRVGGRRCRPRIDGLLYSTRRGCGPGHASVGDEGWCYDGELSEVGGASDGW